MSIYSYFKSERYSVTDYGYGVDVTEFGSDPRAIWVQGDDAAQLLSDIDLAEEVSADAADAERLIDRVLSDYFVGLPS